MSAEGLCISMLQLFSGLTISNSPFLWDITLKYKLWYLSFLSHLSYYQIYQITEHFTEHLRIPKIAKCIMVQYCLKLSLTFMPNYKSINHSQQIYESCSTATSQPSRGCVRLGDFLSPLQKYWTQLKNN